jgi:hypothetical protein
MELGRVIRKAGLLIYIGRLGDEMKGGGHYNSLPGVCLSACALAYLGGKFRWIDDKSIYGVHRFYAPGKDLGSDTAQIASSTIVQFIRDMGIDSALFSEMTKAGKDEINVLSRDKLEKLNVINNGQGKAKWTIEANDEGLYLKGEQETWRGINKFIVYCQKGHVLLHVIFDPEGRGDEIVRLGAQSLFIDDKTYPISSLGRPELINGLVNASFVLSGELVAKLKAATSVGVAFQAAYGAPTFLGFNLMELDAGREKLLGLLGICR